MDTLEATTLGAINHTYAEVWFSLVQVRELLAVLLWKPRALNVGADWKIASVDVDAVQLRHKGHNT